MYKLKCFGLLILMSLTSCVTKVSMSNKFYETPTKVGVLLTVDSASVVTSGSQGLLDMAISSGRKYKKPLKAIADKINPEENTKLFIEKELNSKNKKYEFINYEYNPKDIDKFEAESGESKQYFKKDLRPLKAKLNIDELMIVGVRYGIMVSYYGMIETGRQGYNLTGISVVDLDDNKILFQDNILSVENLKGKWNKEPYENVEKTINKANEKSIEKLNGILNNKK